MRSIYSLAFCLLFALPSMSQDTHHDHDEITFIKDIKRLPDVEWQSQLRNTQAWQTFIDRNGTWFVEFNEETKLPHKAYGKPIATTGNTLVERAQNFIQAELGAYHIDLQGLEVMSTPSSSKHTYVHFKQRHNNLDVLGSRVTVKLDQSQQVISFTTDVYDMSEAISSPAISSSAAVNAAKQGLTGVQGATVSGMATLPLPTYRSYDPRLVYTIEVHTDNANIPGHFVCYVDAENGSLLYRTNKVKSHDHTKCTAHEPNAPVVMADVTVTATVFEEHPFIPATVQPLRNLNGLIGGQSFTTDANGSISTGLAGPVLGSFELSGEWSTVFNNAVIPSVTPSLPVTLQDGANTVSFDNNANIRELSAYYHVNIIHDHMKSVLPSFTALDFSLPTNVDVTGTCNAFYDGSSINFYQEGNDCQSYAQLGEVVYHEYGHGINDFFYQGLGGNFSNGAMNEGYADVWALTITLDGVLAEGSSLSDPTDYIRRYDMNPKVYPADLVGQVHADGEIICGAWWDTYIQLGNDLGTTLQLFADAFPGMQADTWNGNEGVAYRDVLVDVLQADDNDGDITNGTPNGAAIVEGFAIHGITLLSNAELDHVAVEVASENQDITIDADLTLQFPFTNYLSDVTLFYKVNGASSYTSTPMNNPSGNNWTVDIPGQSQGSIVAYYLGVADVLGQLSAVTPLGANGAVDPNLPHFILVDMQPVLTEDLDFYSELGTWDITLPTDDATTGLWAYAIPVGSFLDPSDPSTMVQPDFQNTPSGEFCFVTGNAGNATLGIGTEDVDAGTTTLRSDVIDLSGFTNPVLTYYRWWSNNTGAQPNQDPLEVRVSDDAGATWQFVEYTRTSDRSWRRNAVHVSDYVSINDQFRIQFNASDSTIYGGSLVEAALDDIVLWDNAQGQSVNEFSPVDLIGLFPDPANDLLNISVDLNKQERLLVEVYDMTGRMVIQQDLGSMSGHQVGQLNVSALEVGEYALKLSWNGGSAQDRFMVLR